MKKKIFIGVVLGSLLIIGLVSPHRSSNSAAERHAATRVLLLHPHLCYSGQRHC